MTKIGSSPDPVFDEQGQTVAWLFGERLVDPLGMHLAVVRDGWVMSYRGIYIGRLDGGWFRDMFGVCVGFVQDASNGASPAKSLSLRNPPSIGTPPRSPTPTRPPERTSPAKVWSGAGWQQFIARS